MTVTDPQASPVGVDGTVVLDNVPGGRAFVPAGTPLTRLNYYDGKFLRAADLDLEQRAHRALVAFSNQAGGPGVVRGFDVSAAAGAGLRLSPGLALDADGRVLFLPDAVEATVADLLAAAQAPQPGGDGAGGPGGSPSFAPCEIATAGPEVPTVGGLQLYLVCIGHVDGLCGNEEVFGRLCDDACVTATDRPYRLDGVVLSLRPLVLGRPLVTSTAVTLAPVHLRSRVASAWFAGEDAAGGSLLSAAGLASNVWCLGAPALVGDCVPLAVLGWQAGSIAFLDQWTARRERMEPPPRLYWAGRMEMRPWPSFLAQVLQFQCQLAGLPAAPPGGGGGTDPCTDAKSLLDQSTALIQELLGKLDDPEVTQAAGELVGKVLEVLNAPAPAGPGPGRVLVDGGIVELPAAGYLPVDPSSTSPLRDQVQSLMGAGVDLRFCAVRRDQIAHELERAQHMQRISLLQGLDDPSRLEEVDILVPDGAIEEQATPGTGAGFAVDMAIGFAFDKVDGMAIAPFAAAAAAAPGVLPMRGAGRFDASGGRITAHTAVLGAAGPNVRLLLQALARLGAQEPDPIRRLEGATFEARDGDVDVAAVAAEISERAVMHRARRSNAKVISLAEAPAEELLAVWSTASVWGDPFALAVGASVPFQITVDAFVPAAPSALVELRVDGWAKRLPARGVTDTVHFQVTGTTAGDTVNLRGAPDPGGSFDGEVALRQELVDGRLRIVLLLDEGTMPAAFVAWTSGPVAAEGAIVRATEAGQDPATVQRIVDARALEGTGVAQAGEPHHDAAVAALQLLKGAEPDEPGFFDAAVSQLFGAAAGGTTVEVRPTIDWVLFRRRRREDCSGEVELPPVPPSAVAAWLAVAESAEEAAKYTDLLRQGAGGEVQWAPISTVEFEAGTAQLRTPTSSFRQAWQVAGGGSRIAFVGHAATGAGVTLGHSRAVALTGAVAPIAALDPGAVVDDVLAPPAAQMLAATEGSTFFVTYRPKEEPVAQDCVEVMVLPDVSTAAQKLFAEAVAGGEPAEADAREAAAGVEHMGEVVFLPDGTIDESSADAAVAAYKEFVEAAAESGDPRFPGAAFGWIAEDWTSTGDVDLGRAVLAEIADRIGLVPRDVPVLPFDHEDRCPLRLYVLMRQG